MAAGPQLAAPARRGAAPEGTASGVYRPARLADNIRTGQSWFDPARVHVRRYEVTVEDQQSTAADSVLQAGLERGPYVAETYEVAVQRRHVVVDVPM